MGSHLNFEKPFESIGVLQINRPEVLNALSKSTLEQMLHFLEDDAHKMGCKAIILTGAGEKSFIAGADIKEMQSMTPVEMLHFCELGQRVTLALGNAPFLTIAAVNGYALGGGLEIALACDFIYAIKNAKMGVPEVSLGIIPGFGGTQRLLRAVGNRRAKELVLTGRTFLSEEALEMGLINRVCSSETLLRDCIDIAQEVTRHSFVAIMQAKRAIDAGSQMPLTEALELEKNMCAVCFGTDERVQGMKAFLEKRGVVKSKVTSL